MKRITRKWALALPVTALSLLGPLSVYAESPQPTALQRKEATQAFKSCREQAREGDATACWKLWMKKHATTGSEAEVAYAEEHAAARGQAAQPPTKDAKAGQEPVKKPRREARTGSDKVRSSSCDMDEDCTGGAVCKKRRCVLWWREDAPSKTGEGVRGGDDASSPGSKVDSKSDDGAPSAPKGMAKGNVLDFCALKPRADTTRFVKQRVVLFAPANAESVEQDQAVKKQDGARLVREVFAARFPLDRFHNVVATFPGRKQWATSASIAMGELQEFLVAPRSSKAESKAVEDAAGAEGEEPTSKGAEESSAANEYDFVRYSAGCADYIVFPTIEQQSISWEDAKVKTSSGEKTLKKPMLKLTGAMGIFKRQGDRFKLVSTVRADVPSILDLATDTVASQIPDVNVDLGSVALKTVTSVLSLPSYVSALPDPSCPLGKLGIDGVAGLESCPKEGLANEALASNALEERASPICKEATSDKTSPERMAKALVICEVRSRSAQLARSMQKSARGVEGWQLFAPLQLGVPEDRSAPAMSLGKEEGMKIGYGFYAVDAKKVPLGYFKVINVGPGGEKGIKSPSELNLRFGEAPEGARLQEYPQMGISLMPFFSTFFITQNHGLTVVDGGSGRFGTYKVATLGVGGGATVSYDLSSVLGSSETYLRIGGGYHVGVGGENTSVSLIAIDVAAEKGFYLGSRLVWYSAIGSSTTMVKLKVSETAAMAQEAEYSASVWGALARTGLDLMLSPDASLRLEVFARINFGKAAYKDEDDNELDSESAFGKRRDHFSQVGPNLAFAWTF